MTLSTRLIVSLVLTIAATHQAVAAEPKLGHATVSKGQDTYTFAVTQCVRNVKSPHAELVVELQVDGVPEDTPAETIEAIMGVVDDASRVTPHLHSAVEYGPILSYTRIKGGGDTLAVTNLKDLMWTTDGSPMEATSRSLKVSGHGSRTRVSGNTTSGGQPVSVEITCP